MAEAIASQELLGFGQGAPVTRYGVSDHRHLTARMLLADVTPATLRSLQAIMDQVKAGGVAFWRDAFGGMLTVSFAASMPNKEGDQQIAYVPPFYRAVALKMTEAPDTIGPYVSGGSAQGYLTLVNGRRPPLDTSERLL